MFVSANKWYGTTENILGFKQITQKKKKTRVTTMFIIQIVDQNSLTKIMKSIDYPVKFYEICINLSKILKSSIILLNFIQKSSGSCFQSHKKKLNFVKSEP